MNGSFSSSRDGMTYSEFIGKMNVKGIALNRKVLADLALNEPKAFEAIVNKLRVSHTVHTNCSIDTNDPQ